MKQKKAQIIIVTGTPGTGKTAIATAIAMQTNAVYIDVKAIIKKEKLAASYDRKRKAKVVDIQKLNKVLTGIIKEAKKKRISLVIDSHLSHYVPARWIDLCLVTKTNLKNLKKRLQKRGYSQAKIRENMDCEIFDICLMEAKEMGHKVRIVET